MYRLKTTANFNVGGGISGEVIHDSTLIGKGTSESPLRVDQSKFAKPSDLNGKQDALISGTNIKTINGTPILGSGNLVIESGTGGLSSVAHDNTLTGSGTNASPLKVDTTKIAQKSDIPDTSNFITKSVNNLTYYTKTSDLGSLATKSTVNYETEVTNKPTIPSEVTESTVSGWGFTKNTGTYSKPSGGIPKSDLASSVQTSLNKADTALQSEQYTGTYSKPSGGIPKSDLASAVQTSLGKADTALQSYTEQYTGTITGITMNGVSKGTSGVVDLGTVITAHQDISGKENITSKKTIIDSNANDDDYPSTLAVKKYADSLQYEYVDEIPADADHNKKYVLPDGYVYVWQEGGQPQEYDANRTDYTGDEEWKNRALNKKPDLANAVDIKRLTNVSGVLLSAVIPYGPNWAWDSDDGTTNTNTNKTKVEIKSSSSRQIIPRIDPISGNVGNRSIVIYYYDENGTYLGNVSTNGSQIIKFNSDWSASGTFFLASTNYNLPVYFKCMDANVALGLSKYPSCRYVRIAIGISDSEITDADVSDIKIHFLYYDTIGGNGSWVKTETKSPIHDVIDDTFKVSTEQKLYAIGDSITWGYKSTGSGVVQIDSWVKHLVNINGYQPITSVGSKNLGISGIGFCVPTLNFGVDPLYLEDSDIWKTDYSDADIITVALGINDWRDVSGVATYTTLKTKMLNLCNRLRNGDTSTNANYKGNKNCKIYFILPFNEKTKGTDYSNFYSLGWKNTNYPDYCCGKTLKEFIEFIKDTLESDEFKEYRVSIIDLTESPAINRHNMTTSLLDGLHPTEATHAELGKEIAWRILLK